MATPLLQILDEMAQKIDAMGAECRRLRARNAELEEEARAAREASKESQKERDRARLDVEFLQVSHKLADNPDTLVATRRRLARLIRNIDRCLEMLKE